MVTGVSEHKSRIVVTGSDASGRSKFISDGYGEVRWPSARVTSTVIWESIKLPAVMGSESPDTREQYLAAPGGVKVFTTAIAPDHAAGDGELFGETGLEGLDNRPIGFHQTPTIDIITVISGEIYAVMDEGEILLKAGDSLVQHGTAHGWSNRSNEPAVISGVMLGAVPNQEG